MTLPSTNARLSALRNQLRNAGVAAFLVPRADEHQNEYVAPADERLKFISGFSGSAGLAVITLDKAALFTDGRYTIQAGRQLNPDCWQQKSSIKESVAAWLADNLKGGARVGFDPRLHRSAQIEALEKELSKSGLSMFPLEDNPVDAVWQDRPDPPCGTVVLHPPKYAGTTSQEKLRQVAGKIAKAKLDALLVSAPDNLSWLFNIRGNDIDMTPAALGYALVKSDATAVLFLKKEKLSADLTNELTAGGEVEICEPADMGGCLKGLGDARIRLDAATASVHLANLVRTAGATPDVGKDPVSLMKAQKSSVELEGIRAAHRRDGLAVTKFLSWLSRTPATDLNEWSAARRLHELRSQDPLFRMPSFATISAVAANAAEAHYQLSEETARQFADGDIYLVDSGGQYLDGTTDITRVTVFGEPTAEMRHRYTQVLKGHVAISRARFPKGVTGAQLDPFARQFLWLDAVDFQHGTGHGVGAYLSVHEGPQSISSRGTGTPLLPGMLISNEPGYYKAGAFGIRIENLIVVREADPQPEGAEETLLEFETVTLAPYERRLIDTSLLTIEERQWIDGYHATVAEALAPGLEGEDRAFLDLATAPL